MPCPRTQQASLPAYFPHYPFYMLSAKQGICEYHFLKSFGMTRLRNEPQVYRLQCVDALTTTPSRRSNKWSRVYIYNYVALPPRKAFNDDCNASGTENSKVWTIVSTFLNTIRSKHLRFSLHLNSICSYQAIIGFGFVFRCSGKVYSFLTISSVSSFT